MKHSEFEIGQNFFCNDEEWKCTDIGTRVIVAIKLSDLEGEPLTGPPYVVYEHTLDEYDLRGCSKEKTS